MSRMVIVVKRAIVRFLKQHGYVLLKQDEHNAAARIIELEEHNRQLTELATEQAARAQRLDRDLLALRTEITKRVIELEEHNRHLTESATKHALRNQKLERAIGGWVPEFEDDDGTIDYAKASGAYVDGAEAPVAIG